MTIETTLILPQTPDSNTAFYERTVPDLVLSSQEEARKTTVPYGVYDSLSWQNDSVPAALNEATTWGIKNVPGLGPVYFANQEDGGLRMGVLPPPNN